MSNLLNTLNAAQQQAVETTQGAVLVLAGAGTGKTRVLIHRLAYVLEKKRAAPWECLCVTFTNKAAEEMQERLSRLIGSDASSVWMGTFHRIGLKLIRPYLENLGLKAPFSIFDEDDSKLILKKIMQDLKIDIKVHAPTDAVEKIARLKDSGLLPEDISTLTDDFANGQLLTLYRLYQKRLIELNAVDFGDLILYPLHLMKKDASLAKKLGSKFKYILVDEYQDTNAAQYQLLKKLAAGFGNLCCVGDEDQSIYSWRGADIGNILNFQKDFPQAVLIRLEDNYRSTAPILKTASHLISHNTQRLGKTLRAAKTDSETPTQVHVHPFFDGEEEARFIAEDLMQKHTMGLPWKETAILIRSGYLSRGIEDQLIENDIPYRTVGTIKFYERAEIKDALSYFRLVVHPQDDLAFERIINTPRRGVGAVALSVLHEFSKKLNKSLFDSLKLALSSQKITGKTAEALTQFVQTIESMQTDLDIIPCDELGKNILEKTGYFDFWKNSKESDASFRFEHLKELIGGMKKYPSLTEFLEHISLVSAVERLESDDHVLLMTLHASKGLEFECVYLPAWEEGIFPNDKALEEGALEEERRLAYVGLTRAQKYVHISYVASRFLFGTRQHNFPSCFIRELPTETICIIDNTLPSLESVDKKAEKIKHTFVNSLDVNSFMVGRNVSHKQFGIGEVLEADATTLTIIFEGDRVEKVHARHITFL